MATIAPPSTGERRPPPSGSGGRPPRPPRSAAATGAQAAAFRRAMLLMLGTLLVPGSAQRFAGNKRLGKVALRIWLVAVALIAIVGLVGMQWPTVLVSLVSNDTFLTVAKVALAVLGVGWLFLILDTWRLGRPPSLSRRGRLGLTATAGLAFALVAMLISTGMSFADTQRELVGKVFAKGPAVGAVDGRYNVLVVGGDAGADREGLRPDSLTVVSVDAETGQSVLVGIPRNLMNAPFPDGSPLAELWPNGFDCGDECIINSLYTWANTHPEELPGYDDPGLEATRQAAEGVTGLSIPYLAVVDMAGFEQMVDALGGVTVDIGKRVPIGGGTSPIEGYIEPGVRKLNGYEALWFARSREGASDYERMVRQKCLTSSLARQADPITLVRNYQRLAEASAALIQTDIPTRDLPGLLAVAHKVPGQQINSISLVPPLVNPVRPDFDQIHLMVQRMLAGEAPVEGGGSGGDGSVGNAGSSAEAATQGSVKASPSSAAVDSAETPQDQQSQGTKKGQKAGTKSADGAPSGTTAQDLGLICQAV